MLTTEPPGQLTSSDLSSSFLQCIFGFEENVSTRNGWIVIKLNILHWLNGIYFWDSLTSLNFSICTISRAKLEFVQAMIKYLQNERHYGHHLYHSKHYHSNTIVNITC